MLITSTLLDNFAWMRNCPATWRAKATKEFVDLIRRQNVFDPSPEVKRGMEFEDMVCKNVNLAADNYRQACFEQMWQGLQAKGLPYDERAMITALNVAETFRQAVIDGNQQEVVKSQITVDGDTFTFWGKADVVQRPVGYPPYIIDIKTTTNYKGAKKYLDRAQHDVYCYSTEIERFIYVVANWGGTSLPVSVETVETHVNIEEARERLACKIRDVVQWLRVTRLWEDYIHLFSRE